MERRHRSVNAQSSHGWTSGSRSFQLLAGAVVVLLFGLGSPLRAQNATTFRYFYDETGQLQKVADSTGVVIEYVYDPVGNILEIRRSTSPPGSLSLFGFTPGRGASLTTVTIRGQGFAAIPTGNTVRFNGVVATVISATVDTLVAVVPVGATSGPISVTVGPGTVTSAVNFIVTAGPVITSVSPRVIDATRPPPALEISGVSLTGATFSFLPALQPMPITTGTPVVNPTGTAAALPITVAPNARGRLTLVATNVSGTSDSFPSNGNTVWLISAQDDTDSDGDGFPDGLEALFGSGPSDASSVPNLSAEGDVTSGAVAIRNTASLPGQQDILSAAFSLSNRQMPGSTTETLVSSAFSVVNTAASGSQPLIGQAFSVLNTADTPTSQQLTAGLPRVDAPNAQTSSLQPLSVSLGGLVGGQTVVQGQTLTVRATVVGANRNAAVTFSVNGVPFVTDPSAPYATAFTVPWGVPSLTFGASVGDSSARTATSPTIAVTVEPDVTTSVTGRVVDAAGNPVAGAAIELLSNGLQAEFFDYPSPLNTLPNLNGVTPVQTTRVTAVNIRGPNGVFGIDPFGTGMAPDYAARFTGWVTIFTPGLHTFYLGADEGARLRLGGVTVVEMPTAAVGGYQERSATVNLDAGLIPIEITFYESVGNAQLQLSFSPPDGERQVVPPARLVPNSAPFVGVTDTDGRFTFQAIPTALAAIQIRATVTRNGQLTSATSAPVTPVSGRAFQLGDLLIQLPR